MRLYTFLSIVLICVMIVPLSGPARGADSAPNVLIQEQIDELMSMLKDETLTKPDNRDLLKQRLINKFEPLFVFREMTQRALGVHARDLNDKQIDELTVVFRNLLEEIYVARLTSHLSTSGETTVIEKIEVTGTELRGSYARVKSTVLFRKGEQTTELSLNYRMVNRGQGWKIYDVEIEGVSLIANYRSQFSNILTNESYKVLLQRLREKLEQKRADSKQAPSETTPEASKQNNQSTSP